MSVEAILTCWGNSHPFQERRMSLTEPAKIGRSVAQSRPSSTNAIFDCKVLSRNHALMWFENGKFFLQDTKSSNGTFVNNQRLSKGAEESTPKEIFSNDILQFGVDVVENSRKVTHSCIIATLKLLDADGKEIIKSSLTNDSSSSVINNVQSQEFYQLLQYLQEALHREQLLESKLLIVQQLVQSTQESTENNWQNLVNEEKLLSRLETLEKQLCVCSKLQPEGSLKQELLILQNDKFQYESIAKDSLRKVIEEKIEAVGKLTDTERVLSNKEDECTHLKELCQLTQAELNLLSEKYQDQFKELQGVQQKLQDLEHNLINSKEDFKKENEILLARIDDLLEEQERLHAKMESLRSEKDFNNEQLNNVKAKMNNLLNSNDELNKIKSSQDEATQVDLVNFFDLHLLQSMNHDEFNNDSNDAKDFDNLCVTLDKLKKTNNSYAEEISQENHANKEIVNNVECSSNYKKKFENGNPSLDAEIQLKKKGNPSLSPSDLLENLLHKDKTGEESFSLKTDENVIEENNKKLQQKISDLESIITMLNNENHDIKDKFEDLKNAYELLLNGDEAENKTKLSDDKLNDVTQKYFSGQMHDDTTDVCKKQNITILHHQLDNALQNLNALSRHSQTVSVLSVIPFLVLFLSFIIAFYPFFANITATTTFSL